MSSTESPMVYISMDRRQALARGEDLPERTRGTALFADISGFTPLTEALAKTFGPQRGAEELTGHLNAVYDALIAELHGYGGAVIGFSGDAMTCWFDQDDGRRASACSLAMQAAMQKFQTVTIQPGKSTSLAVKAAVASGPVRRFLVGDPEIQIVEVIAGATIDRLAATEHHTNKGEVVLEAAVVQALQDQLELQDLREDEGERYGLLKALKSPVERAPWPVISLEGIKPQRTRPWLLPAVYERLQSGLGDFLAELRPVTALFTYFTGINYDEDDQAREKLDSFIRQVQHVLKRYEGNLIQLTIGDKGSYLYAAFGAPQAHEDDPARAVSAAMDLHSAATAFDFIQPLRIGITRGFMRTGAYGSADQRTYGVMGDSTNLAARLMQAAGPGQTLTDVIVFNAAKNLFKWESLGEIQVKGKAQPVKIYCPTPSQEQHSARLLEPRYALPMVGRQDELATIQERLQLAMQGHGQVVGITAEAGMGKSRLLAEALRSPDVKGFDGYSGECQSFGMNNSYLVWQGIFQGYFHVDPTCPIEDTIETLQLELGRVSPGLIQRLPLLAPVLKIPLPENDLTRSLDAKLRKSSLEALLIEHLVERAREKPQLFILEDCHWIDPLSQGLLETISRAVANLPVIIFLTYRPVSKQETQGIQPNKIPEITEIQLSDFSPEEAQQLITSKLDQFFGSQLKIPEDFYRRIVQQAEGNPFYIEELLNYLHDRQIQPGDSQALTSLELPDSLHKLILTRIDQVSENQKTTLKIASVIGRLFRADMLQGVYPAFRQIQQVKNDLEGLARVELIVQDTPDPELAYLFKHVITQEVTYESLPFATRARLHEQIGLYLEAANRQNARQVLDLLAYHFEHSNNLKKKQEYLLKAGEAAQADYANQAAIDYFQRVIPILSPSEQIAVLRELGDVLVVVGDWERAQTTYQQAFETANSLANPGEQAWCQLSIGELLRKQGKFDEAEPYFQQAEAGFDQLGDVQGKGQVLHYIGTMAGQRGNYPLSQTLFEKSLQIRRQLGDKSGEGSILSNLGVLARYQGDDQRAKQLYEESLEIRREVGNRWAIAVSLSNLGHTILDLGDGQKARTYLEESVKLYREVGDRLFLANALNNLANVNRTLEDYDSARKEYLESLQINSELGAGWALAYLLEDIGILTCQVGQPEMAMQLVGAAATLREKIHSPRSTVDQQKLDRQMEKARQKLSPDKCEQAWAEGKAFSLDHAVVMAQGLLAEPVGAKAG